MASPVVAAAEPLHLNAVIGFGGKVVNGLKVHQDGVHVIYPLGSTLVIRDTRTASQAFLHGHTDRLTCVAVSRDGRYLASGQRTEMGSKAQIIVWDFAAGVASMGTGDGAGAAKHKLVLHKVAVQALDFSPDGKYLASLGGQDDNSLAVWEVESGRAICGSPAGSHAALAVSWFNNRSDRLVTGGQYHLRSWDFNLERRRLTPEDWRTGSVKRIFTSIAMNDMDTRAYCGTSSGDLLEFNATTGNFVQSSKNRFSLGILCAVFVPKGPAPEDSILIGTGDGALVRLGARELDVKCAAELLGGVSSISLTPDGNSLYAGTENGNVYTAGTAALDAKLRSTAHKDPISDVVFPEGTSELFLTASGSDIRIWNTSKRSELLRIQVPNLTCNCIAINAAGTCIVSGWDDGKIRAFLPESGKLVYAIADAHAESVTAIAFTHDGKRVISGGKDARVRVWNVAGRAQVMEYSFKEHKKEITAIRVSANDEECVSASADGSCLLWNLKRGTRTAAVFASTIFRAVSYHPDESQLLTAGSDRKITYWDTADCTAIRVMEGSTEEVMSLDIERDGVAFVSGGLDRLVKLWLYDEGELLAVGAGHSGAIQKVAISPDKRIIVSVGAEGAAFIWDVPPLPAPAAPVVPISQTLSGAYGRSGRM